MNMRKSKVLAKLRKGEVVNCFKLNCDNARLAELIALCGFDCIWTCMEHVANDWSAIEQQIWFEEVRRAGAPLPFVTLNTVGPALMARGSEVQKQRFLRGILEGRIHFAIGYTRPQ